MEVLTCGSCPRTNCASYGNGYDNHNATNSVNYCSFYYTNDN